MKRFWSKVRKTDSCWVWQAAKSKAGYGYFRVGDKMQLAHRFVMGLPGAGVSPEICVCHHCDNPSCVRPDHLFLGTHADNVQDKIAKGRGQKGSAMGKAKLSESDIPRIRDMLRCGAEQKVIALWFYVCRETVSQIKRGIIWRHVNY